MFSFHMFFALASYSVVRLVEWKNKLQSQVSLGQNFFLSSFALRIYTYVLYIHSETTVSQNQYLMGYESMHRVRFSGP